MATLNLQVSPGLISNTNRRFSFVKNIQNGSSSQTVWKSVLFPLAITMVPNHPIFQPRTCLMSPLRVRASGIKNDAIPPATEIGVPVFILNDNKILFGLRGSTSIADNTYGLPGGHLEFGESVEECAMREVKEETGLDIKNIEVLTTTKDVYDWVFFDLTYMRACLSDPNQTPQIIEPDKCICWGWYELENLPEPMFGLLRDMLQGGFNPFSTVPILDV